MKNSACFLQKEILGSYFPVIKMTKSILLVSIILLITSCSEESDKEPRLDTLTTAESDYTATTAVLKGEFTFLGNMKIIEYGIELSKNQLFSPSQTQGIQGSPSLGVFQVEFTGLEPNTLYYYKAYALINTAYVYSGNRGEFTTKQ